MAWAKTRVKELYLRGAMGINGVSYREILVMSNQRLLHLFNECIRVRDVPGEWITTVLIGIPKKGKPADEADSYRVIGLECCLLKLMTLLVERRLRRWAEDRVIIPPSQNGFREKCRTANNIFVLRAAIEKARALERTLYVVFLDLTNAFPSTDQTTLWLKLRAMGTGGPVLDWLRMVYDRMQYTVHLDETYSLTFRALIGILAGDSASPILWLLFMADLHVPEHVDDVVLNGEVMSRIEQADDLATWSTSLAGTQVKLDAVLRWGNTKVFIQTNVVKTVAMVFGPLPTKPLKLHLGSVQVRWVSETCFLGAHFCLTERNIFVPHYKIKADKVRQVSSSSFVTKAFVGHIPAWEGCLLYSSLVDPHLTYACEVMLDVDSKLLETLEDVQHLHLRRVLGLSSRCTLVPLFTELGLHPLRYRRVELALRYFQYACSLADHAPLIRAALAESLQLARTGHASWVSDLHHVLSSLPVPVFFDFRDGVDTDRASTLGELVQKSLRQYLADAVATSPKLVLLRGRKEVLAFRPYLNVQVPEHRTMLTHLLVSDHPLAMERLRWTERYHPRVPRHLRVCRLCRDDVEEPLHALFQCEGNAEVAALRRELWAKVNAECLWIGARARTPGDALRMILEKREMHALLAKYARNVVDVFESVPLYIVGDAPVTPTVRQTP